MSGMDQSQCAASAASGCYVGGSAGAVFAQLVATLMHAQCLLADRSAYPPDAGHPLSEYDFVVIGAGSAGSAVAARLSENPAWKVLLIEAGGDPPPTSDIPMLFPTLQKTEADWSYLTEPDGRTCLANVDKRCAWPRGKALGGSSVINAMIYIRGSPQNYDGWAALGNQGWSYQDVLPFFKKLEAFDEEDLRKRPDTEAFHGRNGAIQAAKPELSQHIHETLDAAVKELGYQIIEDFSAEPNIGFGHIHSSIKNGTRWSAARGYLQPARKRQNLYVMKHGYVTKVLIGPDTMAAYGVQYLKGRKKKVVKVKKEVILSAGAINTPHILMHSGIGPRDHLEALNITVVRDLKVGYNLKDHVAYAGLYYTRKATRRVSEVEAFEYLMNRTGYLSTTGVTSYIGLVQTGKVPRSVPGLPLVDSTNYPDIQMHFFFMDRYSVGILANCFNYDTEAAGALERLCEEEDALLVAPTLLVPMSRGRIKLKSADPMQLPLIEAGYFADPRDLDNLLDGVELAYKLGSTEAMRASGFTVRDLPLKACSNHPPLTRQYWRCAAPYVPQTIYHPVGTAKMGPASDPDAVVDSRLRVHGVRNLRVADASIMPVIVRCNTNVPSIMIAEKCAHMVNEDWKDFNSGGTDRSEL